MKAVALIPARAGSTRVKNKNFRGVGNQNLVELAIETAKAAGFFSRIVLSTDSVAGEELSERLGVFLHRRSTEAASNAASASDVLRDIKKFFAHSGVRREDYIFYLQPTSPRRSVGMLQGCWEQLRAMESKGMVSVVRLDPKYRKALVVREGVLDALGSEHSISANQQSLDSLYLANGNFFIFQWSQFLDTKKFPILGLIPVVQDDTDSVDIDTETDFLDYITSVH